MFNDTNPASPDLLQHTTDITIQHMSVCLFHLQEDEFLVVSTDGLWDVITPKDAMLYARKELLRGKSPQEVRVVVLRRVMVLRR